MAKRKEKRKDPLFGRPKREAPENPNPIEEYEGLSPEFDGEFDDLISDSANDAAGQPVKEATEQPAPASEPTKSSADTGKQSPATPIFPFPERTVFLESTAADGKATLQDVWSFMQNAEELLRESGVDGNAIDYLRGSLGKDIVKLVVKYVGANGLPVHDVEVPKNVAQAIIDDFCRLMAIAQPTAPAVTAVNNLIMSHNPEDFQKAYKRMSPAEKRNTAASMAELIRAGQQPAQPPTPQDSSSAPTQPEP